MSQGLVAHARTVSQRLGSVVYSELLACVSDLETSDDDAAFLSVVKTAIKHGGMSIQDLSAATGYAPCVFQNILDAEVRVPKMEWARQENPRRHIFVSIKGMLQHRSFLRPAA